MIIEHMIYISIVAEIANIVSYLGDILNKKLPSGFSVGSSIYNLIYALCIILVFAFESEDKTCKIVAVGILLLSFFKDLLWAENPVICIVDSLVCLVLLAIISIRKHKVRERA